MSEPVTDEELEDDDDPQRFKPPAWLTEPYAILRVHVREYYRLQRARIRAAQQHRWLLRWYPTIQAERLQNIVMYGADQRRLEEAKARLIAKELKGFPWWTEWAESVRGIGPILAANVLGEGGPIERFQKVSAVWRYWGASVVDGRTELAQEGEVRHFSRYLKTARFKIGESFVKIQGPYQDWFRDRKRKEEARIPELTEILRERRGAAADATIKGVQAYAHRRATRWVGKLFLSHAWEVGRTLAGLPTGYAYAISMLGHPVEHHIPPPNWTR